MNRTTLSFGGSAGAITLLGLIASNQPTTTLAKPSLVTRTVSAAQHNTAPAPARSLVSDQDGPWYAVCREFTDSDPEDRETNPAHRTAGVLGTVRHPSRRDDALIETEETYKTKHKDIKYLAASHMQGDLGSCITNAHLSVHTLIVTVPDPIASHLALSFDRQIVALERAAQETGYSFARYWLPWNSLNKQPELDASRLKLRQTEQETIARQPGVLIFRKHPTQPLDSTSKDVLFMLLIGETPTGGVNKVALAKALLYTEQLSNKSSTHDTPNLVSILGPNFSGSYPTLVEAINSSRTNPLISCFALRLVAANTTVGPLVQQANKQLTQPARCVDVRLPVSSVTSFTPPIPEGKLTAINQLETLKYESKEVVLLSEDETASGQSYRDENQTTDEDSKNQTTDKDGKKQNTAENKNVATLIFPRDLSSLRNDPAAIVSSITPANLKGLLVPEQGVALTLHEPGNDQSDSPPAFSQDQSPAQVELALRNIVTEIVRHNYHVALITASNPLDKLYLLQYLRHYAPQLRLVTFEEDLLTLDVLRSQDLRGVMAVTPFPLRDATYPTPQLEDSLSLGIYEAAKSLISSRTDQQAPKFRASFLGYDGYWPVDSNPGQTPYIFPGIPILWSTIIMACGVLSILQLWRLFKIGSALFNPGNWHQTSSFALFFHVVCLVNLLLLQTLVFAPTIIVRHEPTISASLFYRLAFFALLVSICFSLLYTIICTTQLVQTWWSRNSEKSRTLSLKQVIASSILLSTVLIPIVSIWLGRKSFDLATAARYIYLLNGLSPLPFFAAVLLAQYFSARGAARILADVHLRKVYPDLRFAQPDKVQAGEQARPWIDNLLAMQWNIHSSIQKLLRIPDLLRPQRYLFLFLLVAVLIAIPLWTSLRGLENTGYLRIWAFTVGISLLAVICLVTICRAWEIWGHFRRLLRVLDASPISSAFCRLSSEDVQSKVWDGMKEGYSYQIQTLSYARLFALASKAPSLSAAGRLMSAATVAKSKVLEMMRSENTGQSRSHDNVSAINAALDGPLADILQGIEEKGFCPGPTAYQKGCAEYLALRYVAMFRYVNRQIREMLIIVCYGYTLLLIGVLTYPFEGQRTLHLWLSLIFVVLCASIAWLLYEVDTDPILSKLEGVPENKVSYTGIASRLLGIGGVPALAVLASQFPGLAQFFFSWVSPLVGTGH